MVMLGAAVLLFVLSVVEILLPVLEIGILHRRARHPLFYVTVVLCGVGSACYGGALVLGSRSGAGAWLFLAGGGSILVGSVNLVILQARGVGGPGEGRRPRR